MEDGVDLGNPPSGVYQRNDGISTVISASQRSLGAALALLAMSLFWNGILSTFLLVASAATLKNMGMVVPPWFPAPVMNGKLMDVGTTLFLWIFLTPFILIGTGMIVGVLVSLAGRTEVEIGRTEASVFTGVGAIGYRRRFDPGNVTDVRFVQTSWQVNGQARTCIIIGTKDGRQIKCGSMLSDVRRKFLAASLRKLLIG